MKRKQSLLSRFLFESMEIAVMPRSARGVKLSFRPWVLFTLFMAWLAVTLYAVFTVAAGIDYGIIKADNRIMKAKLSLIATELERTRKYLQMTRDTDMQMRQMLGMSGGRHINMPEGIEKGKESREVSFRDIFTKQNIRDFDEGEMTEALTSTTEMLQGRLASFQEIAWFYANRRNVSDSTPSIRPATDARISSGFGYRLSPFGTRIATYHYGIDFAGKPNSRIVATADGTVRQTGWAKDFGQTVLIDHGFGFSTLYGHLADIRVKKGDAVKRGQVIANMGTTGRSTGVHLHYEVWKDGVPVNPRPYFK